MQDRQFGQDGSRWSALTLGCSRIGSFGNPAPTSQIRRVLDMALENGVTVFDTANIYGQGDSEREIGRMLARHKGADAYVLTKVGQKFSTKMKLMRPFKPVLKALSRRSSALRSGVVAQRSAVIGKQFDASELLGEINNSRRRLGRDMLDGLMLHSPTAEALADAAMWDVMGNFKATGKVRHIGVSCDDVATLSAALELPGLDVLQVALDTYRAAGPELIGRIAERKLGLMLREILVLQPGVAVPDALAGVLALPAVTTAIVGTTNPEHLRAAMAAVSALD